MSSTRRDTRCRSATRGLIVASPSLRAATSVRIDWLRSASPAANCEVMRAWRRARAT
ncbi:hypothetical protein [Corynebacterium pollutisoli]|uniref:hypothetical protein n=1 Tax=Corynebacterium pollutisoli TaxID=1610489 RepID=UPI0013563DB3|nr:hypothetical protein [Corynebacterium pollutisoli]